MRYMRGKVYFNKDELKALEIRNPTLWELAEEVAGVAPLRVDHYIGSVIVVDTKLRMSCCPQEVFGLRDVECVSTDALNCDGRACWSLEGYVRWGKTTCWGRRWNEFVDSMRKGIE